MGESTARGTIDGVAAEPAVRVFLLGRFHVDVNGLRLADSAWRRKKARQLFKCLLSRPQRRLAREELIELLWAESDADTSSANLRSAIHAMRRALEPADGRHAPGVVFADRDSVWLRPDVELWVDADAFERTIDQARNASTPLPLLEMANALYAGEYLPDDQYEDWANARRDALKREWIDLQFRLSQEYDARGDADAAARPLQRLLDADRCDERAACELMGLLTRHGRRAEALRVYRRLEQSLREDLGVEPSSSALALQHQAARGEALAQAQRRADFRCAYPFPHPEILFGRDEQLGLLENVVKRVQVSGQIVFIGAPAGTGKSAILGRLVRFAEERGVLCLAGGCYEQQGAIPLGPFHEALADFLLAQPRDRIETQFGGFLGALASVIPELRDRLAPPDMRDQEGPGLDRLQVFGAIHACLRALATQSPLLLCIEDLHTADEASLQLLHYLARQTRRLPLAVIGTYRDDEVGAKHPLAQVLGTLDRERLATRMHLPALDRTDTTRLAQSILHASTSDQLSESLYGATGGNPFFIEQLLLALSTNSQLQLRGGTWHGSADIRGSQHIMHDLVVARSAGLSPAGHEALAMAAVIGQTFDYDTLAAALDPMDETSVLAGLDECIDASILVDSTNGYAFRHALLREAVYWELSTPRRMLLHTRAGEALERRAGDRATDIAAELAHHFGLAGHASPLRNRALRYSLVAGQHADRLSAYRDALRHFSRACELIESGGAEATTQQALDALEGRGRAERELAMWPAAIATFQRVLALTQDVIRRAQARSVFVSALLYHDPTAALAEIESGLAELDGQPDEPTALAPRIQLQSLKALVWFLHGRFQSLSVLGDQMLQVATRLNQPLPLSRAQSVIAWAHLGQGRCARAIDQYRLALTAAERSENKIQIAAVNANLGAQYRLAGEFERARQHLNRAIAVYRECAGELPALNSFFQLAWLSLAEGDLNDAEERARFALELAIEGRIRFAAECHDALGTIAVHRTDWDVAEDSFRRALEIRREVHHVAGTIESLRGLGHVYEGLGQWDSAREIYREAATLADTIDPAPQSVSAWRHLGSVCLLMGDDDAAADLVQRAVACLIDEGMDDSTEVAPTWMALAQLRRKQGDSASALAYAEQGVKAACTVEHRIQTHLQFAACLLDASRPDTAWEHAAPALELARRFGAPRLVGLAYRGAAEVAEARGQVQLAAELSASSLPYFTRVPVTA